MEKKDGTIISGAETEIYRIEDAEVEDTGTYTLTAINSDGSVSTEIIVDVQMNTAPTNEIRVPTPETTFTPGNDLYFRGYGIDPQSGTSIDHFWQLEYHQGNQITAGPEVAYQEIINSDTESAGWFTIPEELQPQRGDFYRMFFTVRDHLGLTATDSIDIPWSGFPTSGPTLTIRSNPLDLAVMVDGETVDTPFELAADAGSTHTISGISLQNINGYGYAFSNWAHGGPPSQSITMSDEDVTYTVNYSSALTGPWRTTDVGAVNVSGTASYQDGTFSLGGSGKDIWEKQDAFRFVYRTIEGDVDIRARVTSLTYTHHWAKAGVMIRNSTDPRSKHVMTVITPSNGASFQRRMEPGNLSAADNAPASAPYWVRLVRESNIFTSYISPKWI